MKVNCTVDTEYRDNDHGHDVEGTLVTCTKCGAEEFSFGTSDSSVKRCLAMLSEGCSTPFKHYYSVEGQAS